MTHETAQAFWRRFKQDRGIQHDRYEIVSFGDSEAMMDALADLVVAGRKRATAGLLRDYSQQGQRPQDKGWPAVGDLSIVVDAQGRPRCMCRTTEVRIGPLSSVDAAFAYDEGEGDRSREYWLASHHAFFSRLAAMDGFAMHDAIQTVFQRFAVIWPVHLTDPD